MPDSILYTIGHSNHPINNFLHLLNQHKVTAIGDVRSQPYSRYNPQFNRETLQKVLNQHGIAYVFLGEELGARRENQDCYLNNQVQFSLVMKEPFFKEGLSRLKKGMEKFKIALMCAEKEPTSCHRMILVCRALSASKIQIQHILANGSVEENAETEKRLLTLLKIAPDMFRDLSICIQEAYETQGQKISFKKNEPYLDQAP